MPNSEEITTITTSEALKTACDKLKDDNFVTVDTEFLREKTYYPKLCLVQLAGEHDAFLVDVLAPNIDLAPLFALFRNEAIIKVFHAASQDLEIIYYMTGHIPHPIFDTQIAAMVCGFGESASYATLAQEIAGVTIDKSSRFTDWSKRPLTAKQAHYALSDVTHLRVIYKKLAEQLHETQRESWLKEEMENLTDPNTYITDPEETWKRVKTRSHSAKFLTMVKALCVWRENTAKALNIPRGHVVKDQVLLEIAASTPLSIKELRSIRGVTSPLAKTEHSQELIEVIAKTLEQKPDKLLLQQTKKHALPKSGALVGLLKVLLKLKSEQYHVAEKLIASADDLAHIAHSDTDNDNNSTRLLHGWRWDVFGKDAIALKKGEIALSATNDELKVIKLA